MKGLSLMFATLAGFFAGMTRLADAQQAPPTLDCPACLTPVPGYPAGSAMGCNYKLQAVEGNTVALMLSGVPQGMKARIDVFLQSSCAYATTGSVWSTVGDKDGKAQAWLNNVYDGDAYRLSIFLVDVNGNVVAVPTAEYWLFFIIFQGTSPTNQVMAKNGDGSFTLSWTPPVGDGMADVPDEETVYDVAFYGPSGGVTLTSPPGVASVTVPANLLKSGDEWGAAIYPYRVSDGFAYRQCNPMNPVWQFAP